MSGSINKVILIGNLGANPEIKTMQSGNRVANLSIATSESWKDKTTGERKERTEWHRVVVFNQGLVGVCENYLKKGAKIYVEGQLETRSWEQEGQRRYSTEIVLRPYSGDITMLEGRGEPSASATGFDGEAGSQKPAGGIDELDDEIPF